MEGLNEIWLLSANFPLKLLEDKETPASAICRWDPKLAGETPESRALLFKGKVSGPVPWPNGKCCVEIAKQNIDIFVGKLKGIKKNWALSERSFEDTYFLSLYFWLSRV